MSATVFASRFSCLEHEHIVASGELDVMRAPGFESVAPLLLAALFTMAGCGANSEKPDAVLTGEVFSVSCERAWSDCYAEAQRRCVGGDWEEIDRSALQRTTVDDRSIENQSADSQATYRAVTIRCK